MKEYSVDKLVNPVRIAHNNFFIRRVHRITEKWMALKPPQYNQLCHKNYKVFIETCHTKCSIEHLIIAAK